MLHENWPDLLVETVSEYSVTVNREWQWIGHYTKHICMSPPQADEAYCIGPPPSGESYLRQDRIIQVAKLTGAQVD